MIIEQFFNSSTINVVNDFYNLILLTCTKNFIILIISSFVNQIRIKSNFVMQYWLMKIFKKHVMINTKFFDDDRYVFCRIAECLISNSLIIIKIISKNNNFMIMKMCKIDNQFLYTLIILINHLKRKLNTWKKWYFFNISQFSLSIADCLITWYNIKLSKQINNLLFDSH